MGDFCIDLREWQLVCAFEKINKLYNNNWTFMRGIGEGALNALRGGPPRGPPIQAAWVGFYTNNSYYTTIIIIIIVISEAWNGKGGGNCVCVRGPRGE